MVAFVLVSAAVGFLNMLNNIAALTLFRGPNSLRSSTNLNATHSACCFSVCTAKEIFINEIFLGPVALSLWFVGLSFRLPAAVHRCLANDQLFRLRGSERDALFFPPYYEAAFKFGAAGPVWRGGDHAVALIKGAKVQLFQVRFSRWRPDIVSR